MVRLNTLEMTMFKQLNAASRTIRSAGLQNEVDNLIDSGRINADDTVYAEKAAPESDWECVFVGTIASLLSSGEYSKACLRWFAKRGVSA